MSIRSRLAEPLQIVFRAPAAAVIDEEPPSDDRSIPLVALTVYAGDSLAFGQLALSAARVTDLMNDHDTFEFVDTTLQSLDDGHGISVHDLVIARGEVFAVAVAGPRGDPERRTRTRPIPVQLHLGRFDISGNLHVVPGADPLISFRRRRVMVPLTEATIEYDSPAGRVRSRFETILVNRLQVDWIAPAASSDVRPPDLVPDLGGPPREGLHTPYAVPLILGLGRYQRTRPSRNAAIDFAIRRSRVSSVRAPVTCRTCQDRLE